MSFSFPLLGIGEQATLIASTLAGAALTGLIVGDESWVSPAACDD